jgi:integrase
MASITKRNNTYTIRVSLGYDGLGKQIQRFKTWKPEPNMTPKQIEKELERQKVLFEEQCNSGSFMGGNMKFSDFADYWLKEYAEKELRPKTITDYKILLKRINTAIGHIRLDKLQPHHIMKFYNNLRDGNIREDVTYKAKIDALPLLKKKKLTQAALAEKSGISINTVQNYVHGVCVSEQSALKIAAALKMPHEKIFIASENKNKPLAPKTISNYHRLISAILEKAVKWQILMYNPCRRVEAPKVPRKETNYLDEVQASKLLNCLESEPLQYKAMITTLLYSGMRRGELCGLEWADIDFDNNLIDINKSSLYLTDRGIFDDTTKTESSKRVIKVPQYAIDILKRHSGEQSLQRLKLGDKWINSGKVFTQWNGKPIHPDTISGWFGKFLKRHNLPHISIHSLRHTNATLLIAGGADLRTVSKRLGHADMTTTANIYTHAIQSADERAAQVLDAMLPVNNAKAN